MRLLGALLRRSIASNAGDPTIRAAARSSTFSPASDRVPNLGSTARDHLANERTFLAWARTGLGFLGSGTGLFTAYHLSDLDGGAPAEVDAACGMLVGLRTACLRALRSSRSCAFQLSMMPAFHPPSLPRYMSPAT
mmetsp:Transcript_18060/g.45736  ORF Transcript_18060/g.45736 Transcript_18060/m.45736 type:complete len:136 (-) Transcript_18060:808-1215(-)